jgi:hypothetical protein
MAFLLAGRAELGVRMRLSAKLHLALVASCTVHYGLINYAGTGIFAERAGTGRGEKYIPKSSFNHKRRSLFGTRPGCFFGTQS